MRRFLIAPVITVILALIFLVGQGVAPASAQAPGWTTFPTSFATGTAVEAATGSNPPVFGTCDPSGCNINIFQLWQQGYQLWVNGVAVLPYAVAVTSSVNYAATAPVTYSAPVTYTASQYSSSYVAPPTAPQVVYVVAPQAGNTTCSSFPTLYSCNGYNGGLNNNVNCLGLLGCNGSGVSPFPYFPRNGNGGNRGGNHGGNNNQCPAGQHLRPVVPATVPPTYACS